MKRLQGTKALGIGAAALALAGLAWAADDFDRWWKPELDAVTAAPGNHRILLENDDVRVLEVIVPPHSSEPLHVHRYPAVIYVETSPHLKEHLQDGTTRDLGKRTPGAHWLPVSQGHAIENVDDIPLRAMRVELKKSR